MNDREYLYRTIEDYEKAYNAQVNSAFQIGWYMARKTVTYPEMPVIPPSSESSYDEPFTICVEIEGDEYTVEGYLYFHEEPWVGRFSHGKRTWFDKFEIEEVWTGDDECRKDIDPAKFPQIDQAIKDYAEELIEYKNRILG